MNLDKYIAEYPWVANSKGLIQKIREFPKKARIILMLRHSHRLTSPDPKEVANFRITEIGLEIAEEFGKSLPSDRSIRVFSSRVKRCVETAESIVKGYTNISNTISFEGIIQELSDVGINTEDFFREIEKYPFDEFLHRWTAGLYSEEIIPPLRNYAQKAANAIWKRSTETTENGIDIHVSHDLILLSMRLGWFGLSPRDYWPTYLSGFAFTFQNEKINLLDFDGFKRVELPFWWKG